MTMSANVGGLVGGFYAKFPDGRSIAQPDLSSMAQALVLAGVKARGLSHDRMAGYCMLTAGQKVALSSEMLALERHSVGMTLAA
jgi:hypothetical protein